MNTQQRLLKKNFEFMEFGFEMNIE